MQFETHGGSALRRDNRDHGLPQCEMSLLAHRDIWRQRSKRLLLGYSDRFHLLGNCTFLSRAPL